MSRMSISSNTSNLSFRKLSTARTTSVYLEETESEYYETDSHYDSDENEGLEKRRSNTVVPGTVSLPPEIDVSIIDTPAFQFESMTREEGHPFAKTTSGVKALSRAATAQSGRVNTSLSPFQVIKMTEDKKRAYGHPVIMPTPYGTYGPVFDVIALYHNAVKRQSLVAFNMVEAMLRYKWELGKGETEMFWGWFDIFKYATLTFMALEEDIVFPFLNSHKVKLPEKVGDEKRKESKDVFAERLGEINDALRGIELLPAGESITKISKLVAPFINCVLEYFEMEKVEIPKALKDVKIGSASAAKFRSQFMKRLKSSERGGMLIAFVSHWLSAEQLKRWKEVYLVRMRNFTYDRYARKFRSKHLELPVRLNRRLAAVDPMTPRTATYHTGLTPSGPSKRRFFS